MSVVDIFSLLGGYLLTAVDYLKNLDKHIVNWSASLLTKTYEALTKVVLNTPAFLFDGEWLKQNTLTFTGLAIVVTVCIALYEGFIRLIGMKHSRHVPLTDMKRVYSRFPFIILLSSIAPRLFHESIKALNWVTHKIIELTSAQMEKGLSNCFNPNSAMAQFGIEECMPLNITAVQVALFVLFDLALIGVLIPIFLQNFRRWFELLVLAAITPLALACWMFESTEHLYHTWRDAIKQRSTVQLIYAIYLMIIGALMFGTGVPEDGWDFIIKLGVMVGGFFSLTRPPELLRRYINYRERTGEVVEVVSHNAKHLKGGSEKVLRGAKYVYLKGKRKLMGR